MKTTMKTMVKTSTIRTFFIIILMLFQHQILYALPRTPKLTIIIIIDQFAYHYIDKLYPHLRGGIKYLLDKGIDYTNAYHPHGTPVTGTGHAAFSTGVYAKDHGIIGNSWNLADGTTTWCDDDASPDAAIFAPDGELYEIGTPGWRTSGYGKSPQFMMVDTLTDQFVLQSQPFCPFRSYSISLKSQPSTMTAGRLGKPIWVDSRSGNFTSSHSYFQELPDWLNRFNQKKGINTLTSVKWNKMFPKSKYAYSFFNIHNYQFSDIKKSLVGTVIPVINTDDPNDPYQSFTKTPDANKMLIDLAKACINEHVSRRGHDRMLLWLCLSPLDLVGHEFGPDSLEAIDMIYHIDEQLNHFLRFAMNAVGKSNLLVALTGDHGVSPIPEIGKLNGLRTHRIDPNDLIEQTNALIFDKHTVENIIASHSSRELYLNQSVTEQLKPTELYAILDEIKEFLLQQPGIKNVWTFNELLTSYTEPHSFEDNIRKQLFPGRSGDIIIQTYPYAVITDHPAGTTHETTYNYDTHVPLVLFQSGTLVDRTIRQRISTLQFANTIAELLYVPKPSASIEELLPGIFDWELQ